MLLNKISSNLNYFFQALREKEKGDWRQLSHEEKRTLYRASFRQTFAEFKAPTGEWKSVIGVSLFFVSLGLWVFYAMKLWGNSEHFVSCSYYYLFLLLVYSPLPETFNQENREAQLRRIIDLQINPVQGISSKWDYEKDDWKK